MSRPVIAAALCLGAWTLAASPAMGAVRSGPLTATVGTQRWALAFEQARGGPTLRELAGGRLGFRTAGGWRRATRILARRTESRALVLRVATDDPAGRRLSVRLRPSGGGIIALVAEVLGRTTGVSAVGIAFG